MLRYADARVTTIWVQTDVACEVEILASRERTWCVDGLHFALVAGVRADPDDGDVPTRSAWTGARLAAGSAPDSRRARAPPMRPAAGRDFGSCRITRPHVAPYDLRASEHPDGQGVDALRAYALRLAGAGGGAACPDMLVMLGDQIYADEPSPALREVFAARDRPPGAPEDELADFPEYAMAYGRRGRSRRSAGCSRRSR